MWLCEDKAKGKTAHFRLPFASQKRACLRSLLLRCEATGNLFYWCRNITRRIQGNATTERKTRYSKTLGRNTNRGMDAWYQV